MMLITISRGATGLGRFGLLGWIWLALAIGGARHLGAEAQGRSGGVPKAEGKEKGEKGKKNDKEKDEDEEKEKSHDLKAWGQIKKLLKGEEDEVLCEISYRKKDSRGRPQLTKAFLRIPKDIVRLKDQRVIKLTDLEPDETIKIFGRPAVYRVPHRGGVGGGVLTDGQDRQIQNAKAALAGKEGHIEVNKAFKDKQDPKLEWVDAQVEDTGGGLTVLYQGTSYRVAMAKNAPIIRRGKAESKDFERKGTKYIYAVGNKSRERPTALGSADEKYDCFDAELVILLDGTSMRTAYPMIIEGF